MDEDDATSTAAWTGEEEEEEDSDFLSGVTDDGGARFDFDWIRLESDIFEIGAEERVVCFVFFEDDDIGFSTL